MLAVIVYPTGQVVLDDLGCHKGLAKDTEAFADLLLQCTAFDAEWDDTDEWNALTLQAVAYLRQDLKAEAFVASAESNTFAAVRKKASVLRRRLGGERAAGPTAGSLEEEGICMPGVLSMNTRVQCPVCMVMQQELLRCPQCRNVGYCSMQHLQEDAPRHSVWCSSRAETPSVN
ncbi:unnamed protein product [Symbiodinium natans]|uniref:MYND-type domain-containing protein n=1 Tax=Symbiodinium natans TaxID=878477 RepID=A0A812QSD1_9DINO|nr:unnamed protein product [Symbiodinium natans]